MLSDAKLYEIWCAETEHLLDADETMGEYETRAMGAVRNAVLAALQQAGALIQIPDHIEHVALHRREDGWLVFAHERGFMDGDVYTQPKEWRGKAGTPGLALAVALADAAGGEETDHE